MENWTQIKHNIQSELAAISDSLEKIEICEPNGCFEVSTDELFSSDTENSILKQKVKDYLGNFDNEVIYTVDLKNCKDYDAINTAFDEAKSKKKGKRAYSKHNNNKSGLLYVGSSQSKYLITRIRNHLGIGSRTVYSLHIKEWLPQALNCTIVIRVFQAKIPNNNIQILKMLEIVEQGLWDAHKPLFGKRSGLL
jgi:hypothetical protein